MLNEIGKRIAAAVGCGENPTSYLGMPFIEREASGEDGQTVVRGSWSCPDGAGECTFTYEAAPEGLQARRLDLCLDIKVHREHAHRRG